MIIDAENLILGRVASFAAKNALVGEQIDIVNCEKAIVMGDKKEILVSYKKKQDRGTHKGPIIYKNPERFFKRTIRGMLPYKKERGEKALKNIKCHIGIPDSLKDKEKIKIEKAAMHKANLRYTIVKDICKMLGAKI